MSNYSENPFASWLESAGIKRATQLLESSPHSHEILEAIKEDYECKVKSGFHFKNGPDAWLAWAISSSDYRKPTAIKTKTEIKKEIETKASQREIIKNIASKIQTGEYTHFLSPTTHQKKKIIPYELYTPGDDTSCWSFTILDDNGKDGVIFFRGYPDEKYFQ